MNQAEVAIHGVPAGRLTEEAPGRGCRFAYLPGYAGPPVSLTLPVRAEPYVFEAFPAFFDGLLPEGFQLEALLRQKKLDRDDRFGQLLAVGGDTVGAVTLRGVS